MKLIANSPKKALNKAFLKEKVSRTEIEKFKKNLKELFSRINDEESEEHFKNILADFLKDTWYKESNEVNTKGRSDLAIYNGKTSRDSVGVIIEVKRPNNKSEMLSHLKFNVKAFHEIILYYLRERYEHNNSDIKHLIVTNVYEWYIIDEKWFEENIKRNAKLRRDFDNWKISGKDTRAFYDLAKIHIDELSEKLEYTYFDLRVYKSIVNSASSENDTQLIALYKFLSPTILLKLPFANDSNSLDRRFYSELLHIIGLEEKKENGRKLIKRKSKSSLASILENTILQLEDKDCLRSLTNLSEYGKSKDEQLFNIGIELCITWINRILFLKLLEAQLFKYHKKDISYKFLNIRFIQDYDELNTLFFQVLAESYSARHDHLKEKYQQVPYLNSSLFERTDLERKTIDISALKNGSVLDFLPSTVLKDEKGRKKTEDIPALQYLFEFLDSYDFTSEGSEEIQEENKNLINASVLGLIFEKINGYKDGSFFTPGSVTMYICHETIRKTILSKFNEVYSLDCMTFEDLKNYISSKYKANDILEFNRVVNGLKICDPAVGSGHFLVSALNEIIAIKAELGILADTKGVRLSGYDVKIENDELIITFNDNTEIFEYQITNHSANSETQRVQKTLFHEKETIIENCLFGVDINPNSVKICRLRLWIELLKNTYYKESSGFRELETLPNLDINIKCGNSLISRFPLDVEMTNSGDKKHSLKQYKEAFHQYHHAATKDEKRELESLINQIKGDYTTEIFNRDPKIKRLSTLRGKKSNLENKVVVGDLFSKLKKSDVKKEVEKIITAIEKIENDLQDIKQNRLYINAFEWRLEFPDILNDDGSFGGFDVIIGNPPYVFGGSESIAESAKKFFKEKYITGTGKVNLFTLFMERGFDILKPNGSFAYIIPNTFLRVTSYDPARRMLIDKYQVDSIFDLGDSVFDDAVTTAIVVVAEKRTSVANHMIDIIVDNEKINQLNQNDLKSTNYLITTNINDSKRLVLNKIEGNSLLLGDACKEMIFGVVITKNKLDVVSDIKADDNWKPFLEGKDIGPYLIKPVHSYINYQPELLHRARTREIFEVPEKIMLQRITGGTRPLKAAYDNKQRYNKESINNIILKENSQFSYKYILALLNSKLINWYYTSCFTNESKLTVNLSKEYLSQIPIVPAESLIQEAFIRVVDYILFLNEEENIIPVNEYVPNTFLTGLFSEILDAMTFELYFKNDFITAELEFIKHIAINFESLNGSSEAKRGIIHEAYQRLRQKENIIRNNLKLMDIRVPELIMPIKSVK